MGGAGACKVLCALSKEWLLFLVPRLSLGPLGYGALRDPWALVEVDRTARLVVLCHPCFLLSSWGGLTLPSPDSTYSVKKAMTSLHPAHPLPLISHPLPSACLCLASGISMASL